MPKLGPLEIAVIRKKEDRVPLDRLFAEHRWADVFARMATFVVGIIGALTGLLTAC